MLTKSNNDYKLYEIKSMLIQLVYTQNLNHEYITLLLFPISCAEDHCCPRKYIVTNIILKSKHISKAQYYTKIWSFIHILHINFI